MREAERTFVLGRIAEAEAVVQGSALVEAHRSLLMPAWNVYSLVCSQSLLGVVSEEWIAAQATNGRQWVTKAEYGVMRSGEWRSVPSVSLRP